MVLKPPARPSPIKEIDPALTLSQDISKFIVDWAHISKVKKIDNIKIIIQGTKIDESDLQELLQGMLMDTIAEKSQIKVERSKVKHFCQEHHVSFSKKCPVCGLQGVRELPKIKVHIKAKEKKAEISL